MSDALPVLLIATGARRLHGNDEAHTWFLGRLLVHNPAVCIFGDAREGCDQWCYDAAFDRDIPWFCYTKSGDISRSSGPHVRWTDAHPPRHDAGRALWGAWYLHRDRVMVQHAAKRRDRYDVRLVGTLAASKGTMGAVYTVARAKALGIPCDVETF